MLLVKLFAGLFQLMIINEFVKAITQRKKTTRNHFTSFAISISIQISAAVLLKIHPKLKSHTQVANTPTELIDIQVLLEILVKSSITRIIGAAIESKFI